MFLVFKQGVNAVYLCLSFACTISFVPPMTHGGVFRRRLVDSRDTPAQSQCEERNNIKSHRRLLKFWTIRE